MPFADKAAVSFRYTLGALCALQLLAAPATATPLADLKAAFTNPPDSAKPGVYWYFMDGNMSREGITRDLESMKEVGIAHVVFLEVSVGVPRGKVDFLSDEWLDLFKHANAEAERLGIAITLGTGPGWAGSGGPWVKPEESMRHLVASEVTVSGGDTLTTTLPTPAPKKPFFGEGVLPPDLHKKWEAYYEDVAVVAFPTPPHEQHIKDADEKALYIRPPYTSQPGVRPRIDSPELPAGEPGATIQEDKLVDLTSYLKPDGSLTWQVPPGQWTIMRFGMRNNGMVTRPAPVPGLGFECDKLSTRALASHLEHFHGKIFDKLGSIDTSTPGGLAAIHIDSWEMGAQNWTDNFREEFHRRRGYDPLPWLPAYTGKVVESPEATEAFLFDVRLTAQELVVENHAEAAKAFAHSHGLALSIEPYDMNPTSDIDLGAVADIPMCEFWSKGFGFNSAFSCLEATSIAHVTGKNVVQAEAFTADPGEGWRQYPGSMKAQGDWAFALGINRFFYHTFAHQPLPENLLPGMTMGPYGVHWDRHQTWWPMVTDYHKYVARCQAVLQQGQAVADILFMTPEGAPNVFVPPPSAVTGDAVLPDKRGYGFDAVSPLQLKQARVKDGQITFPRGASYKMLVLPNVDSMTVGMAGTISRLIKDGAVVMGHQPTHSPSLADRLQGGGDAAKPQIVGKLQGDAGAGNDGNSLYPPYESTSAVLRALNVAEDFSGDPAIRYHHRVDGDTDVYFLSNKTTDTVRSQCSFRTTAGAPQVWNPLTGEVRGVEFKSDKGRTMVDLTFGPTESCFVVFSPDAAGAAARDAAGNRQELMTLEGPWKVQFDPKLGGPADVEFDKLVDWTARPEAGINYYSGTTTYTKTFQLDADAGVTSGPVYLNLGTVKNLARVSLNGHDLGVLWTDPWEVEVSKHLLPGENVLQVVVANLWANRLIGDLQYPDTGLTSTAWPEWLKQGKPQPGERVTFTTYNPYKKDSPLLPSGLIGPVRLRKK